jgi:hypothetical protein
VFQITLNGGPLQGYEIQASTDLTNWSVLSSALQSDSNGSLRFSDSSSTNLNQRFYRAHLLSP